MSAAHWQASKRYAHVLGRRMAYVEQGSGSPIVFLHGNPTSSYLWRTVLPELSSLGRCIAPDLIGMGDSDKLAADDPARYTFARHRQFLDAFLDALGVTHNVTRAHFLQEDSGQQIGAAIAAWLRSKHDQPATRQRPS